MNAQSPTNDASSDEQIVADALSFEEDSDAYWAAIRILQHRITEALIQKMRDFIYSENESQRQLAADVMAQGRAKDKKYSAECMRILLDASEREKSSKVLSRIVHAIGHHQSVMAIGPLAKLKTHPDPDVRLAVAQGLSCQDDPVAIATLIALSGDSDREVRNWATFGLGSMTEVDSIPVREALFARVTERDEEISGEALVGLALRGDTRVAEPLLAAINIANKNQSGFSHLLVDAVRAMRVASAKNPDEAWLAVLVRCDELGLGN